jgi:formylglycine-generating enzyme required for sulfatase activity
MKVIGPGFTADPNGYRSEDPVAAPHAPQRFAAVSTIKDCTECPELVAVPAGGFTMGSSAQEQALANAAGATIGFTESPQHYVRVPSFAAGRYAVTKSEFAAFARSSGYLTEAEQGDGCLFKDNNGDRPFVKKLSFNWRNVGYAQGDDHPVVCVSWNDAQAYIQWLNPISGKSYRLLSEAEREYAAPGGTYSKFWWGELISSSKANYGQISFGTVPVSSFSPNPFGLYNVHGNIWEWVEDCTHSDYFGAPTHGSAWITGCKSVNYKRIRGGSWFNGWLWLRAAQALENSSDFRLVNSGFRLARDL